MLALLYLSITSKLAVLVCFPLTSKWLDSVRSFVSRLDFEARLLAEQTDVNRGFIVPLA